MLTSLAEAVQERAQKSFGIYCKVEGLPSDGWLAIDLGDIVVHIFSPDQREYYDLEGLWARGKTLVRIQ